MSEFSHPKQLIAFHLGDILGVISLARYKPLIDTPPMRIDGSFFPQREYPVQGVIQLAEYVTGEEVPLREAPDGSGQIEINNRWLFVLALQAGTQLIMPENIRPASLAEFLSNLVAHQVPYEKILQEFETTVPESLREGCYAEWVRAKAREVGEYFIVNRMKYEDKEYIRFRKRALGMDTDEGPRR
jgi:hypothetical protein